MEKHFCEVNCQSENRPLIAKDSTPKDENASARQSGSDPEQKSGSRKRLLLIVLFSVISILGRLFFYSSDSESQLTSEKMLTNVFAGVYSQKGNCLPAIFHRLSMSRGVSFCMTGIT